MSIIAQISDLSDLQSNFEYSNHFINKFFSGLKIYNAFCRKYKHQIRYDKDIILKKKNIELNLEYYRREAVRLDSTHPALRLSFGNPITKDNRYYKELTTKLDLMSAPEQFINRLNSGSYFDIRRGKLVVSSSCPYHIKWTDRLYKQAINLGYVEL